MSELDKQLILVYKRTLRPNSKWFAQDLADFRRHISQKTTQEKQRILNNLRNLTEDDSPLAKEVEREIKSLDKAGMYDIRKIGPEHQLD